MVRRTTRKAKRWPPPKAKLAALVEEAIVDANGESELREPQKEAHRHARRHFARSIDPAILQIPVGGGKPGVMATLPFGIANGRVLIITPNLTILRGVAAALDITTPNAHADAVHRCEGPWHNGA
jgi:superfamily II DNA or RNA helicase